MIHPILKVSAFYSHLASIFHIQKVYFFENTHTHTHIYIYIYIVWMEEENYFKMIIYACSGAEVVYV